MTKKKGPPTTLAEIRATEALIGTIQGFEETEEHGMRAKIRIIKAGLSKNNRNYRPAAIEKAAQEKIFDGVRMFVDHNRKGPIHRRFDELVSVVEDTYFNAQEQALDGYARFVDRPFFEKAKAAKDFIGVSIDSMLSGVRIPQPSGRALEDIYSFTQPRSVDWVLFPAAGGGILAFESLEEEDEEENNMAIDWAAVEAEAGSLSDEDIKKNLPSLWKKFHPETQGQPPVHGHAQEGEADTISKDEVEEIVKQRLTAYENEKAETARKIASAAEQVKAAFASSGLPDPVRGRVMRGFEGVEEYDEAAVKQAITDAQEELKLLKVGPKITDMGPGNATGDTNEGTQLHAHEGVMAHFGVQTEKGKKDDSSEEGK